jgi:hypothetical protein
MPRTARSALSSTKTTKITKGHEDAEAFFVVFASLVLFVSKEGACGALNAAKFAPPLIRPASQATFSRRGRRKV